MFRRYVAVMAAGVVVLGGVASAQGIREQAEAKARALAVEIKAHSDTAKAESGKGAAAMEAGDKAGACVAFTKSRAEAQAVIDLLAQQREQVMIATEDAATALARIDGIDKNSGVWTGLASQLEQRKTAACGA